jgi:hypothetical protein
LSYFFYYYLNICSIILIFIQISKLKLFYNFSQQALQNLSFFSHKFLHFLHFFTFSHKSEVDSIKIRTVTDEIIAIKIGHKNIKIHQIILQRVLTGTKSQYQTVVIVTTPHQIASGIEEKVFGQKFFSTKYIKIEKKTKIIKIEKIADKYSTLCL